MHNPVDLLLQAEFRLLFEDAVIRELEQWRMGTCQMLALSGNIGPPYNGGRSPEFKGVAMKWVIIALAAVLAIRPAAAAEDITAANVQDRLILEKTKAENLVLSVKSKFKPSSPQYAQTRLKYSQAQIAFNNYTKAMLSNYKVGNKVDLRVSASTAAQANDDFQNYVLSLHIVNKSPTVLLTVLVPVLLEVGEKLFEFIRGEGERTRERLANAIAEQITWSDWNAIGA
jgi:hypothetical protein